MKGKFNAKVFLLLVVGAVLPLLGLAYLDYFLKENFFVDTLLRLIFLVYVIWFVSWSIKKYGSK